MTPFDVNLYFLHNTFAVGSTPKSGFEGVKGTFSIAFECKLNFPSKSGQSVYHSREGRWLSCSKQGSKSVYPVFVAVYFCHTYSDFYHTLARCRATAKVNAVKWKKSEI